VTKPYRDFSELILYARKDHDYAIRVTDRSAAVTVAAIHAGLIEPLTGELAEAIAGQDSNLYLLQGLLADRAERLRIPVTRYDDVRLTSLLDRSEVGISIHGAPEEEPNVHLGGRNRRLCTHLQNALQQAGFRTAGPAGAQAAHSPSRFVNRPAHGGVQLEFSLGLRRTLTATPLERIAAGDAGPVWTDTFHALVRAIRQGVTAYFADVDSDLALALERFERATPAVRRALPPDGDNHHAASHHAT